MLGSTTVSAYTAFAPGAWGEFIDMNPEGLAAEGGDPALHATPYCPGAPLTGGGTLNPTAEGLQLLSWFLDRFGRLLLDSELRLSSLPLLPVLLPLPPLFPTFVVPSSPSWSSVPMLPLTQ